MFALVATWNFEEVVLLESGIINAPDVACLVIE